ncbi:MAG: TetR/AcrR family transcriptional regulator, partial [Gordonia paraffinivorans]
LVSATAELLRDHGPAQIKARRVAEAVGASTITIYHHFGGVPELLSAVVTQGFSQLGSAFAAASELADDPSAELFAMALSTRALAQANAHLYDLMFGLSTRGTYRPLSASPDSPSNRFAECYAMLAAACGRLIATGRLHPISADDVASELWSAVHGFVTLEAAGQFERYVDPAVAILRPLCTRIIVGMGDSPDSASRGAETAIRWWAARDGRDG